MEVLGVVLVRWDGHKVSSHLAGAIHSEEGHPTLNFRDRDLDNERTAR
jgi:hypothetical protein